jgi:DNA primase RepB-like protein
MDAKQFFSQIWPTALVRNETLELRAIDRKNSEIKRSFHTSVEEFLEKAHSYGTGWDIYFGVSTRFQSGGKKSDCFRVRCVWMDFDKKDEKLPNFGKIQPDIVVNSGGGFHVYWLLRDPVFLKTGRWAEVEAVTRGLSKKFGGDPMAIDIARILRVPGFLNYKYDPPRMVECIDLMTSSDLASTVKSQ